MHITLPTSVEEELIGILNHAAIGELTTPPPRLRPWYADYRPKDYMTSDLSTVPYNPEQCDIFIKRLQSIPGTKSSFPLTPSRSLPSNTLQNHSALMDTAIASWVRSSFRSVTLSAHVDFSLLARIYAEVTGNYFVNLHGETNSRLSRNQRLLPPPDVQTPFLIKLVFKLGFGAGMAYYARLEDLWVDKIGYMSHWRVFMKSMIKEWKQISQWGLMLLL